MTARPNPAGFAPATFSKPLGAEPRVPLPIFWTASTRLTTMAANGLLPHTLAPLLAAARLLPFF